MKGGRPDFSDAGYGQIGCALIVISAVGGWVVGLVGSWLLADAARALPAGLAPGDHASVVVGSMALSLGASVAAMWVIERVPRLWRRSDLILLGLWLAPGPIVTLVIVARLELAVDPLALAAVAAFGFIVLGFVGDRLRAAWPRGSATGSRSHHEGVAPASVLGGLLGNVAGTLALSLIHMDWLLPERGDAAAAAAVNLALGWGLALVAGVVAGYVQALVFVRPADRRPSALRPAGPPRSTLIVAAATSGIVLWWLASVNT